MFIYNFQTIQNQQMVFNSYIYFTIYFPFSYPGFYREFLTCLASLPFYYLLPPPIRFSRHNLVFLVTLQFNSFYREKLPQPPLEAIALFPFPRLLLLLLHISLSSISPPSSRLSPIPIISPPSSPPLPPPSPRSLHHPAISPPLLRTA